MKAAFDYLRRAYYRLSYYYQKFQLIVMSFVVVGIVDYFLFTRFSFHYQHYFLFLF